MFEKLKRKFTKRSNAYLTDLGGFQEFCSAGYVSLDKNPEIISGVSRMAELIGSMTIHLMANKSNGDERIVNELSKKIDINPISTMTRIHWMNAIVMNLLLYGKGNSIVLPHTDGGYIGDLEPIPASQVSFESVGAYNYRIRIQGVPYEPDSLIHFVHNPDKNYMWKGQGLTIALKDVVSNLKQASDTSKSFMSSKWKPSLIIRVDALTDEFASPEGREKLLESYVRPRNAGDPWLIPAEQLEVQEVRPLTLNDLAMDKTIELDKRTVASILGIPPFVLGIGEYNQKAWNSFVSNTIRPICREIEQELTRKLLISPNMYFRFNIASMMDYDLETLADVFGKLSDKGIVTGNEVRDKMGMSPMEGLDELRILENYIPADEIGNQKKLIQED